MSQEQEAVDKYGTQVLVDVYQSGGRRALADYTGIRYNSVGHLCKLLGVYTRDNYIAQRARRHKEYWNTVNPLSEDNDIKWYLVGFILGDGSIREHRQYKYLSIASSDEQIISDLAKLFSNVSFEYAKGCYQFTTGNEEVVNSVLSVGISPNKSRDGCKVSVPSRWRGSFLRGLLDSDGYVRDVTKGREVCWYGHPSYMKDIAEWLNRPMFVRDGLAKVSVCSYQALGEVIELMYSECSICLERKRERCLQILRESNLRKKK